MAFIRFGIARAGGLALILATSFVVPAAEDASAPHTTHELAQAQRLIDCKDWTAALVELKQALRRNYHNADAHSLMGYSYRKSGQIDDAFDSYRTALRLDPKNLGAHEYIGQAYLQIDQPDKAREHLAALKRICGESCAHYRNLAKAVAAWQLPSPVAELGRQ